MTTNAVIIVSWNCREALKNCLACLEKHAPKQIQILVVDNASSDATPSMIRTQFPHVMLLEQKQNLGFAKANNLACRNTDAEYLFILNPDTLIHTGVIERLSDFLDTNQDAALAAPKLIDSEGCYVKSTFCFPNLLNYWTEHSVFYALREKIRKKKTKAPHGTAPKQVDWATGAAFMVRRSALEREPLFDERFFIYSEDADLCRRLKLKGWKNYYIPDVTVSHLHRISSKKAPVFSIFHLFQSMDLYYNKHKTRAQRFFLRLCITTDMLIRLLLIMFFPGKDSILKQNLERRKAYREVIRRLHPFRLKP